MSDSILHLQPELIWKYFHEISQIPRCSKDESAVSAYLISVADAFGLDYTRDEVGNVIIRKPCTPGKENTPTLVLQAHMDMVCEKNSDKVHDFTKDPIQFVIKDDWLYADETTLGADNGIGVATMLAIIEDKELVHGPLEFLITVDEETGMTGAFGLKGDLLQGRMIINLDSEEEGTVYIGCAGGGDTKYALPVTRVPASELAGFTPLMLKAHGLKGGHSGVDILEGRANANKCLIRAINSGVADLPAYHIASYDGGSKRNAIPREAESMVLVPTDMKDTFIKAAQEEANNILHEFKPIDPNFTLDIQETGVSSPESVVDHTTSIKIIQLLNTIPNGVLAMSLDIPDLVETSTNMAVINLEESHLRVWLSTRSSIKSALEWGRSIHSSVALLAGSEIFNGESYPGWKPDLDSKLLKIVSDTHNELFGEEPEKKAIHAGLECGLIKEVFPGMDAVSIGPQIENPHSPTERVNIPSVGKFYRHVAATLARIAGE